PQRPHYLPTRRSSDLRTAAMPESVHEFHDDPRNADIRIWINGAIKPRAEAVVSVFDSGFVLGDGVWEGLRVADGHPLFLDQHLEDRKSTRLNSSHVNI